MEANEPLPDHLRCKRTDGRQWRCNRRVMDDKKLCEIHHLQGRHRQYKRKVPESLKLQRKYSNKKLKANVDSVSDENVEIRAQKEENFLRMEKLGKLGKKRKKSISESRGDLQLELIRMVLKREVEKRKKKKKKKNKNSKAVVVEEIKSDNDNDDADCNSNSEDGDLMRDLPNGLMAISPAKHNFSNAGGSCSATPCDIKIGGAASAAEFSALTRRCFRSKNIEPMPIGALQVMPFKKDMVRLRKGKGKRCHWCRRSGLKTLIRCSSCRKQFFCMDCIKEQYSDMQEEVKIACPVCRGTCSCKACSAIQCRDIECKGFSESKSKVDKVLHFHYLICMLLPVLKEINQVQSYELEIEAKLRGQKPSDIQIQKAEVGCTKQCCCNNCKTSIVDLHRRCPNCLYYLCLSCCRDIFQRSLNGSIKGLSCKCPHRRKDCISEKQLSEMKYCIYKQNNCSKYFDCSMSLPGLQIPDCNGGIPCPPAEFGGCGDSPLDLCSVFPSSWTKELEIGAEEIIGCYELPEIVNVSSCCSLCLGMDCEVNGAMQLQEAATREESYDNFLYYPTVVDIHSDNHEHFQKHWAKGQPVIVRNVLQGTSDLSWDPIVMFCTYLKNNGAKSENLQAADCLDWFEVEIGIKQLFMGSFKGPTYANMWHERLKLKGWLSSHLFQEHFPAHYAEILNSLPLPEYMDPISGVLNIAAELPKELKADLGPCVYISYGSGENLVQADSVTKLRYDSYDVVNILAHTADIPVSTEQLNYIRKLMKKHKEQNEMNGMVPLDGLNMEEARLHDMISEEMRLHKKVARASWFSAASHETHASMLKNRDFLDGECYSDSDSDTDTDTEVSKFFFGPVKSSRTLENHEFSGKHAESSNPFGKRKLAESCGALWDVFRRQDIPKLVEYLRRHSNEFTQTYGFRKHVGHQILDQNFFLDATHKMRLKEEFKIEPWTFEQHVGEAVIIPAGCPYQIQNLKSCVNVVLDFVSPENVGECIQLIDELRLLPENHKAKVDSLEVKKMALQSISRAIKEIRELTCAETSGELNDRL